MPEEARFRSLMQLPEGENIGAAVNAAMRAVEAANPGLKDILPKTFNRFDNSLLTDLLRTMNSVPMDVEGDVFGKVYEYFLGKFAMAEGQKGGEFFTPTSIVRLIVGVIEPFHGRIFDPACGSGGMFVQSARFVAEHRRDPGSALSVFGQERVADTVRLAKMNLAVHGLEGDIRQGNSYYEDLHRFPGRFDFVMANPPFNVSGVDKERVVEDRRFGHGVPKADNANYPWIQAFSSALAEGANRDFIEHASSVATGTRMPGANWKTLARSSWRIPPLSVQRRIGAILSAYDELIENSLRRIEILEDMARNLYREWFVEFRFPGHERTRFVDSPAGRVPEGWAVRALGELAKVQTGGSNRQDADPEGNFVFFDRSREVKKSNRYLFDCEAVVVPGEGREFVARYWVGPFDLRQRVYALTDLKEIDDLYLYHAMLENRDYFARVATGATVKSLRKGMFERFPVVVPLKELRRRFSRLVEATQDQCKALDIRNAVLRQARDALLPKLSCGDIDVSGLPVRMAPRAGEDVTGCENGVGA